MEHLTLLIKPASSLCNLHCKYCFYHNIAELREHPSYGMMSMETAETLIKKSVSYAKRSITFAFQGGEPTLAGIAFYQTFIQLVKEHNNKGLSIHYAIQTNGMNMDEEFAGFLMENKFLVGLSLDGTKEIHDFLRIDAKDNGTHSKVMKTAYLFDKLKVEYNILTVITAQTAKHIDKIYHYYKKCGFRYLQFIPCLDPLDSEPNWSVYSLTPKHYELFLKTLFLLWYHDFMQGDYTSIRFFDNLVRVASGQPAEQCGMNGYCNGQYVIEADGSTFPCDFYCVDHWKTGNINQQSFEEITQSDQMVEFIETSRHNDEKCKSCEVFDLCRGGFRRDRDSHSDGRAGENIYCETFYSFYSFAKPYIREMIKKLSSAR